MIERLLGGGTSAIGATEWTPPLQGDIQRASSRYRLRDPVPRRLSVFTWVLTLVDAAAGGAGQWAHVWSFQVEDRGSGQVVYEVGTSASFDFDSAQSTLTRDLDNMTVEEFEAAYGIGRVRWRNEIKLPRDPSHRRRWQFR